MTSGTTRIKVRVTSIRIEAEGIRSFELAAADGGCLPPFSAGAHIDLHLPSGLVRQYSLFGDPAGSISYLIAALRDEKGRGGSKELHDSIRPGDVLEISPPRNNFALARDAERNVLIAGGIGITPILSMVHTLARQGLNWQLHYCIRDRAKAAFLSLLAEGRFAERTVLHIDGGDPKQGADLEQLTAGLSAGTHLYCCGPNGLMDRVAAACRDWPDSTVHFERFGPSQGSHEKAFEIEIASTGQVFTVPPGESILNVLRRNGRNIPSLCTQGVCGTCIADVLEGTPDHRDSVLFDHERQHKITTCCSRAISKRLKLGL